MSDNRNNKHKFNLQSSNFDRIRKKRKNPLAPVVDTNGIPFSEKGQPVPNPDKDHFQDLDNNLKIFFKNTQDIIWAIDTDYNLITGNPAFHSYLEKKNGMPTEKW